MPSLDELLAVNDEIAALLRAGVPLERGLAQVGRELPGARGDLARELAARLERGESLTGALSAGDGRYPPLYAAVVEAGAKSGRLAVALEGLATVGRNLAELRRLIGLSLVYPVCVLLLAYALAVFFVLALAPRLALIDFFPSWAQQFFSTVASLRQGIHIWGPAIPAAMLLLLAAWWIAASRAVVVQPRLAVWLLGWIPGVRRMLVCSQSAAFSEVLALLIEHNVPLDEAVTLAAGATGNPKLESASARIASQIRQGQPLAALAPDSIAMPPLLVWLLGAGKQQGSLVAALKNSASSYRQRAIYQGELLRAYMPLLLSVAIGGTATLAYTAILFVPWAALLYEVSQP
jgi:general secretion pathway protein F